MRWVCLRVYNHRARPALDHTGPQPVAVFALVARVKTLRRRCSLPRSNAPLHACPHLSSSAPRPRPSCASTSRPTPPPPTALVTPRLKLGVSDSVHAAANLISSVTIDHCWKLFDIDSCCDDSCGAQRRYLFCCVSSLQSGCSGKWTHRVSTSTSSI